MDGLSFEKVYSPNLEQLTNRANKLKFAQIFRPDAFLEK